VQHPIRSAFVTERLLQNCRSLRRLRWSRTSGVGRSSPSMARRWATSLKVRWENWTQARVSLTV